MRFKLFTNKNWSQQVFLGCCLLLITACSSSPESVEQQTEEHQESATEVSQQAPVAIEGQVLEGKVLEEKILEDEIVKGKNAQNAVSSAAVNKYIAQQATNKVAIPQAIVDKYQQALALMNQKKWPQAQLLLDEVIVAQPQLSGAYVNKAIIYREQQDFTQAQILLSKAIAINALNLYAHHIQGQIYRLQGNFVLAEKSYQTALAIWPDYAPAHLDMAILLELYRGRLLDAYRYYSSYLQLNGNDEEAQRWLAGLEINIKRAGLELPTITESSEAQQSAPKESEPMTNKVKES